MAPGNSGITCTSCSIYACGREGRRREGGKEGGGREGGGEGGQVICFASID